MSEIVNLLPSAELQTRDNIPAVIYSLGNTIRNKVLKCQCNSSPFQDKYHWHILTGDLRIIENVKLGTLSSKGLQRTYNPSH